MSCRLQGFNNTEYINIPDSTGLEEIKIKVKKPRIMDMMKAGDIPNKLKGVATMAIKGFKMADVDAEDIADLYILYAKACMVEPTYEEVKHLITDEQIQYIFAYARGTGSELDPFRAKKENDTDNRDGKAL